MEMDLAWWITVVGAPLVGALAAADVAVHFRATSSIAKCHARIDVAERENFQYRLTAAQQYATVALVSQLEHRMVSAVERMDSKLDRLIERNQVKDKE